MIQETPFDSTSGDWNRNLADVSLQGENWGRWCNRERPGGRRVNGLGNSIRETLVYRSKYRDWNSIKQSLREKTDKISQKTYADALWFPVTWRDPEHLRYCGWGVDDLCHSWPWCTGYEAAQSQLRWGQTASEARVIYTQLSHSRSLTS